MKFPFVSVKAKVMVLLADSKKSCKPGIPLLLTTSLTFPAITVVGCVRVRFCVITSPGLSVITGAVLRSETNPGLAASTRYVPGAAVMAKLPDASPAAPATNSTSWPVWTSSATEA